MDLRCASKSVVSLFCGTAHASKRRAVRQMVLIHISHSLVLAGLAEIAILCAGVDYKANKAALDQVPLEQFSWPEEVDPAAAAAQAAYAIPTDQSSHQSPDQSSAAAAATAPADIVASWAHMENDLPADLMKRLKDTAWVCTTADEKIGIDEVQSMISKVLDQAESMQTQVLTEHW